MYDISALTQGQSGANQNAYHEKLVSDAKAAYYDGNYALSERLLDDSIRTAQSTNSLDDRVIDGYHVLARQYTSQRDYGRAEVLYRKVLDMRKTTYGATHADVADSLRRIATVMRQTWKLSEAYNLERSADAIVEAIACKQNNV